MSIGAELGRFLRVLHARETLEAVDPARLLPVDINGRADMATRVPRARENLAKLGELELWTAPVAAVERILTSAEALPPTTSELVLVHGDLHLRHVLVEGGPISGVIDWGDVCSRGSVHRPHARLVAPHSCRTRAVPGRIRPGRPPNNTSDLASSRSSSIRCLSDMPVTRGIASLEREAIAGLERTLID